MGRGATILDPPVAEVLDVPEGGTDHELVAAVRRGDDRAFERLYSRYQRRISAYVYGMVKDHGRAEDITQEVFISALRRMRDTERPITFKPWIYEIAKNACIDQFRRSRRAEEVSFDAGEGLGSADQGRLVASEPTPDAAVDAKQQLDHLCGAFGGLSDSHHEILVLREFEGLSYREIGDRMGLSRPGVESTLFRARKRLTEEYDELVSGERCVRVQSIITAAASNSPLGSRDSRRLARHLAHCQACRRQAVAAGLDAATLARRPLRRRVAERIGAFLPLPGFLRSRLWPSAERFASVSEPMTAGWSKVAAAAATLLVVGVATGVSPQKGGAMPDSRVKPKAAVIAKPASSRSTSPIRARSLGAAAKPTLTSSAGRRRNANKKGSGRGGGSAPGGSAPASSGGNATSPNTPAAANHGGSASTPSGGARKPSGGVHTPASLPAATQQTGQAVTNTTGAVGGAVGGAAQGVGGAVGDVGAAAGGAVGAVGGAVGGAGGAVGGAVGGAGGAVGGAVGGVGGLAGAARGTTGAVDSLPTLGG